MFKRYIYMYCIWKIIKACIPKKSASCKAYSKDDKVVTDEFNEFFTSVGEATVEGTQSLADRSNYQIILYPKVLLNSTAIFSWNSGMQRIQKGNQFNMPIGKAPGNNKKTARLLKNCLPSIVSTLTAIINDFLSSCTFPIWKSTEEQQFSNMVTTKRRIIIAPYRCCLFYSRYGNELH